MKTSRLIAHAIAIATGSLGLACGSDNADDGGVVSCDIVQGDLHYCEEVASSSDADTGCPSSPGYTPGTGCSREGVAGTCTEGTYSFFLYEGSSTASDVLASLCPGGGLVSSSDAGTSASEDCTAPSTDGLEFGGSCLRDTQCDEMYGTTAAAADQTCASENGTYSTEHCDPADWEKVCWSENLGFPVVGIYLPARGGCFLGCEVTL